MRQKIPFKLFLIILAACAMVLAVNGVMARITFMRDFMGYLNDQGVERMQGIAPRLGAAYTKHGGWGFLDESRENWFYLLRPMDEGVPTIRSVPPISDQTGTVLRLALFDMQDKMIAGNASVDLTQDAIRMPVETEGKQVGWLAMLPFQRVLAAGEVRFYKAQVRAWWVNGIASVLVAALLAFLLPRSSLKRLRTVTEFVHRLALGDYSQRMELRSRDELDQLAGDISQLAGKLENIEHNRRAFMADISHELRTPLAVLKAELEAIQDGIRPMNQATLAPLQSEVTQLNKLVNDLHDLAVTQTGKFRYSFEPVDLNRIAHSSFSNMQARASDAGLSMTYASNGKPIFISGDEARVQQLLSNLLENSIRYTDKGGQIRLQLAQSAGFAEILIEDSAPGVDESARQHLFERFFRVEASRNRASGGSGLGLTICRNIVESHQGSISAQASPLGGLLVIIRIPSLISP